MFGFVFVDMNTFVGILRWLALLVLLGITIYAFIDYKKLGAKFGIFMAVLTVLAAPFLVLDKAINESEIAVNVSENASPKVPDTPSAPDEDDEPVIEPTDEPDDSDDNGGSSAMDNSGASNSGSNNGSSSHSGSNSGSQGGNSGNQGGNSGSQGENTGGNSGSEEPVVTPKHTLKLFGATTTAGETTVEVKEGESVTISANSKVGYHFASWLSSDDEMDGNTSNPLTFNMPQGDLVLNASYAPNSDTAYTVYHMQQSLTGEYVEFEHVTGHGESDSNIYPTVNSYTGFNSPEPVLTKIEADGNTKVYYNYPRKQFRITINNPGNVIEGDITDDYYYGQSITLTAKTREHYTFANWSNNSTDNPLTFTVSDELTIGPVYEGDMYHIAFNSQGGSDVTAIDIEYPNALSGLSTPAFGQNQFLGWYTDATEGEKIENGYVPEDDMILFAHWKIEKFPVVWSHAGACNFNGAGTTLTGETCEYFGQTFIDTGVKLFTEMNSTLDFEIYMEFENYQLGPLNISSSDDRYQSTFINAKSGAGNKSGVIARRSKSEVEVSGKNGSGSVTAKQATLGTSGSIRIIRQNGVIYGQFDDAEPVKVLSLTNFSDYFDQPTWFGAYPGDAAGSTENAKRFFVGTMKNMYIKLGKNVQFKDYTITNDALTAYSEGVKTWDLSESSLLFNLNTTFNNNNCLVNSEIGTGGSVECDRPDGYNTGVNTNDLEIYLADAETGDVIGDEITYARVKNGVIYNLIPGKSYYWHKRNSTYDYGYVTVAEGRRYININGLRNVRDLGGLPVDYEGDGVVDGKLKYGRLYRGIKLGTTSANASDLKKLGVNEEIDLRSSSEHGSDVTIGSSGFKLREIKHYQIDRANYPEYYEMTRAVVIETMQDIVNDENTNIYFHCRIGTDRTGTLAYILEGLLGVPEEDRLEDYELSYFYGLTNRHRYFREDPSSSVSKTEKFVYMRDFLSTNTQIHDWLMDGAANEEEENELEGLINDFRTAMVE